MIHGVQLRPEKDSVVKAARTGLFEPDSMALWLERCTPGAVVMDVGAYTGLYTIAAAMRGATVVAVEPNPVVYRRMQENLADNPHAGRVLALMAAAGDGWGIRRFAVRFPMSSAGRLSDTGDAVPVLPLDCWDGDVAAIKVDVEGGELAVLRGAARLLERCHPLLILEALDGAARAGLVSYLEPLGYQGVVVDGRNMVFSREASW